MDQPCSDDDLRACLRDIAKVNRLTLAYRPTFQWLNHVYRTLPLQRSPLHIVDVGCGYGDMIRRIAIWARDKNLPVKLSGVDLNPAAIRAAREATPPDVASFHEGNAFQFNPSGGIDIVINSLLMHHLENCEIVPLLAWMESVSRVGWFVNDLHRKPVPFYLFRALARFTSWHPFVKHDGAVSILRSFRPDDWQPLVRAAKIPHNECTIREHRFARLCVARLR